MLGGDAKPTRAPRETRKRNSVAKERVERDEEDLVRLYLTDIGQYPLLTKDDEVRLAQQIEGGNAARGAKGGGPPGAEARAPGHAVGAGRRGRHARGQGDRGIALRRRAPLAVRA